MPTDEQYREQARSEWSGPDGTFDVDDDAAVARTKGGAWVQAWIWIPLEDISSEE